MPYSNHGRPWATVGGQICWFTVTYCLSNRFLLQYALQICHVPTMGDRGRPWAVTSVGSRSLIASAIDSCYSMHCKYAMFQPWATVGGHICWFTVTYCLSKRFPLQYALRGNVLKGFCQQKSCFPICSRFQQINVHYDHTSFAREVLGYAP